MNKALKRAVQLNTVNERVKADPAAFVAEEETRYEMAVDNAADRIAAFGGTRRLVMQCGPSSVGKTTTANKICERLHKQGIEANVVSLDNFYRGRGCAPLLPDGSYDYESLEALDVPLLRACLTELLRDGQTALPEYDFAAGQPKPERRRFQLSDGAAVIFEGIHAFDPSLYDQLGGWSEHILRVFVNTTSRFADGERVVLSRREIRLVRRLLRDERCRGSSFHHTMEMWQQVVRGDAKYIFPYSDRADLVVDTTIGYEPCVMAGQILPRLHELHGSAYEETARALEMALTQFVPLSEQSVPQNSVLREFLG